MQIPSKSSKCQNFQRVWHLVIFRADQLKKTTLYLCLVGTEAGETGEGEVAMAELEDTVVEGGEDMAVLVVETDMEAAVVEGVVMAAEEGEGAVMEVAELAAEMANMAILAAR